MSRFAIFTMILCLALFAPSTFGFASLPALIHRPSTARRMSENLRPDFEQETPEKTKARIQVREGDCGERIGLAAF